MSYLYLSQFCYAMNKKLLFCGVIAVGLLLVACSKEKEPSQDNQPAQSEQTTNPASEQFHSINETTAQAASEVAPPAPQARKVVEIQREETEHTTTEIRRETKDVTADTATTPAATTDNTTAPATNSSTTTESSANSSNSQAVTEKKPAPSKKAHLTEDDAVAAAIAAAKPALNN